MRPVRAVQVGLLAAMVLAATVVLPQPSALAAAGDWIDPSFGVQGVTTLSNAARSAVVGADPTGRLYAGSSSSTTAAIVQRLSADGIVDPAFAGGAREVAGQLAQLHPNAGGGVTVATKLAGSNGVVVTRLTDAGEPDPSFGTGGAVTVLGDVPTFELTTLAVLDRAGGGVLVVVRRNTGLSYAVGLTSAGAADPTWAPGSSQPGVLSLATSFRAAASDGSTTVVLGTDLDPVTAHPYLFRLTADGAPDLTFGPAGQLALPGLDVINPVSVAVTGGAYFVVGSFANSAGASMKIVKALPSGSIDAMFGIGGVATSLSRTNCSVAGQTVTANAQYVYLGGYTSCVAQTGGLTIGRFTPSGQRDVGYGTNGELRFNGLAGKQAGGTVGLNTIPQPDGRLVVSGRFGGSLTLLRLHPAEGPPAAGAFVPLYPSRILDTRIGHGAAFGPLPAGGTLDLQVAGIAGVPIEGAAAVVVNVTVTRPTRDGNIVVFPTGTPVPLASNLNFVPGQTIPNLVTVKLGTGGQVTLKNNSSGTVELVADVSGYYRGGAATQPGMFTPVNPARILDTRVGTGAVPPGGSVVLQVGGSGGVPATDVSAVVLNVTVTQPSSDGNVVVYPSDQTVPLASNLNFVPGVTIANQVTVQVTADGRVTLRNNSSAGTVHLVVDVAGWYRSGPAVAPGAFVATPPRRLLDTRSLGVVSAGAEVTFNSGNTPVYAPGAMVLNVTVTQPTWDGSVVAYPYGYPAPTASNVNFVPGQTIPNQVIVQPAPGTGAASIRNNSVTGSLHLVVDVFGYFLT